ncbi:glycine--tRNA ligase [candidate division KSB3 bacterium]|uniref:Glycine--tRNA ligase n=1 Tax=candidate division KSB3 bacterium TaxID=2044937 RepID=A0A9D5JX15_9BACT|nr:glycine--tRNA ligase [candidate division KSB3 bacterium]MBD3325808.1 glycine--tRNA ligase [candidate division KSB3 bacterium]
MANPEVMEKIVSLCKRRGFIFQSSEIYGGLNSCWDYGPIGVELKRNVKAAWWQSVVYDRDDMYGLDASILMHPEVWYASGHIKSFSDPLVDCKECKHRFRQDHLDDPHVCPDCGGALTEARQFNLMFKTFLGPVEDSASTVYLRPETAQGIFVNFQNVLTTSRARIPFGIAQIGKAFRNEITPGNFTFRTREFEQMEIEFFVKPGTDDEWLQYWKTERFEWYSRYGITKEKLRLREHGADELAHYAKECYDVEYEFPFGWSELEGIANRTDFDLSQHAKFSKKNLSYFDEQDKTRYVPYVIEPSAGADRSTLAFLVDAYDEEPDRVVLRFHPHIAPITVAVFPLMRKEHLPDIARDLEKRLRPHLKVTYDETGSIGKRYRRQDEIGTPYCLTVDLDTPKDEAVTLRDRDTMEQIRIPVAQVLEVLQERLQGNTT